MRKNTNITTTATVRLSRVQAERVFYQDFMARGQQIAPDLDGQVSLTGGTFRLQNGRTLVRTHSCGKAWVLV